MYAHISVDMLCQIMSVYVAEFKSDKIPRLRPVLVTSPPWGVLKEDHDVALSDAGIDQVAAGFKKIAALNSDAMIALHVPVTQYAVWAAAFKKHQFTPILPPITISATATRGYAANFVNSPLRNTETFYLFKSSMGTKPCSNALHVRKIAIKHTDENKKPSKIWKKYWSSGITVAGSKLKPGKDEVLLRPSTWNEGVTQDADDDFEDSDKELAAHMKRTMREEKRMARREQLSLGVLEAILLPISRTDVSQVYLIEILDIKCRILPAM